jgi:hypothetical protein
MVIRRRHTDKVRYYGCEKVNGHVACGGTYVVAEPLEAFVGEIVLAAIDSPALASELRHLEADTTTDDDLAVLHADEQALEQLARDHYVGHLIERAEYLAARDALHSRVETTRGRMSKPGAAALLRELGEDGAGVRAAWAAGDVDWRRRLVSMLVDRVEIGPATRGATRFDPTRVDPIWRA